MVVPFFGILLDNQSVQPILVSGFIIINVQLLQLLDCSLDLPAK